MPKPDTIAAWVVPPRCSGGLAALLLAVSVWQPVLAQADVALDGQRARSPGDVADAPGTLLDDHLTPAELGALETYRVRPLVAAVAVSPPYVELGDGGEVGGYAAEHLRLLAARLGLEVEFALEDSLTDVLAAVRMRRADVAPGVVPSDERRAYMAFTEPHFSVSLVIFTRTEVPVVSALFGLAGKRVAVVADGVADRALATDFTRIERLTEESELQALRAVANGRAFAYVGDLLSASTVIAERRLDNLKLSGVTGYPSRSVAIGVRSDYAALAGLLDKSLASLSLDELAELHRDHLGVARGAGFTREEFLRYVLAPALVALALLGAAIAWTRSLQRQVRRREFAERELMGRLVIEQLLRQVSDRFASVQLHGLRDAVDSGLAGFARHFGADRAALVRFDVDGAEVACVWYEQTVAAHPRLQTGTRFEQADDDWKWLTALMRQRKPFAATDLDGLPANAGGARAWLAQHGAEALIALPVQAGPKLLGIIGIGRARRAEPWPESAVSAGLLIGGIVGSAIGRLNNERALISARDAAEKGERTKAAFLAAMSHEIRTPMNGVVGMIDLLERTKLDAEQRKMLATTRESGFALLRVIDDVLDFSKIEAGKLGLERVSTALGDIVESVMETLWTSAVSNRVRLFCYVDPYMPARVFVDPVRVRQILFNLIGNAIKFSDGGKVRVHAHWDECGPGTRPPQAGSSEDRIPEQSLSGFARLTIIDTGIGMSQQQMQSLFEPFSQAESSTTRRFGGTGLGLGICHNLVQLMDGDITVESVPGSGSTFEVSFPAGVDASATADNGGDTLAGMRVLIVVDDKDRAWSMGRYLERWDASFDTELDVRAMGARVAAAARAGRPYDVVVLGVGWGLDDASRLTLLGGALGRPGSPRPVLLVRRTGERLRQAGYRPAVAVECEPMRRQDFLRAVAVAGGRASPVEEQREAAEEAVSPAMPSVEEARARGELVLVAEDNETNRTVFARQLAVLGYAAVIVANGRQALEAWRTGRYALLLTDCHMPDIDGYELSRLIRAEELEDGAGRTPIVAVTASALEGDARKCIDAGMDAYIAKPVETDKLRDALRRWLPGRGDAPPAGGKAPARTARERDFDESVLVSMIGDDPEAIHDILRTFAADARSCLAEIELDASAGAGEAVRGHAHKLKSSSRAVGAARLAAACQALEEAAVTEDWPAVKAGVRELEPALAAVCSRLDEQSVAVMPLQPYA